MTARSAVQRFGLGVIKRLLWQRARAAGGTFDDVDISQAQGTELVHQIIEQLLRILVGNVVGRRDRRQANTGASGTDFVGDGAHHFQQQAAAVFQAAAVVVAALVGTGFQKLLQQIAVGSVDFDAVKTAGDGVARRVAVVLHDAGQLGGVEGARHRGVDKHCCAVLQQHGFGVGANRRGCHRRLIARLQAGVRDAPDVPQLHHNFAVGLVDGLGHFFPAVELLGAVQAGHVGVALRLRADGGGFSDQQAGAGALGVVLRHQRGRDGVWGAVARQRCHRNAVGQLQATGLNGIEQSGHRVFRENG